MKAADGKSGNDHFDFAPFVRRCFFKIFNPFQRLSRFVKNVLMAICIRRETLDEILKLIRRRRYKVMCINDNSFLKDFDLVKKEVLAAFAELFPERSSFEKEGVE